MNKVKKKIRYLITVMSLGLLVFLSGNITARAAATPSIQYILWNANGARSEAKDWEAAGDASQSRSEANDYWNAVSMKIVNNRTGLEGDIEYAIHVHNLGWSHRINDGNKAMNGEKLFCNTSADGLVTEAYPWVEGFSAELTGKLSNYYYIDYNVRIAPLSEAFKNSIRVAEDRYQAGLGLWNDTAVKNSNYWVGFDEDLSKVIGDGYDENNLANDGGLNFAGTYGMTLPISAIRAKIEPLNVRLIIKPNGGTYGGDTGDTKSWEKAGSTVTIRTPVRKGYTFKGWEMTETKMEDTTYKSHKKKNNYQLPEKDVETKWEVPDTKMKLGNRHVTLKAIWEEKTATIVYHPKNGRAKPGYYLKKVNSLNYAYKESDASRVETKISYTDTKKDLYDVGTLFTRDGYKPVPGAEWQIGAAANKQHISQDRDKSASGVAIIKEMIANGETTIHLYANWVGKNDTTARYTVNHYQQNSTDDGYTLAETEQFTATANASVTPGTKPYAGFVSPAAQTVKVKADGSTTVNYYYTRNLSTLQINPNGGSWEGTTAVQGFTQKYGSTKEIPVPSYVGHSFAGWQRTTAFYGSINTLTAPAVYTFGSTAGVTDVLTARWDRRSYLLTVKPNGGTWNGTAADSRFVMEYQTSKTITDPTKDGYTFQGWALSGAGSSISGTSFTMGYADAVLEADWKPNTYVIRFDGNGATEGVIESMTATVDEPFHLPENGSVEEPFKRILAQGESKFLGWSLDAESRTPEFEDGATVEENLTTEQGATVVLYAVWDDCPWLEAPDRYFNLWWAQNGRITEEELLTTVSATDREDVKLDRRTGEQIKDLGEARSVSLYGYDSSIFTSMAVPGEVPVTYKAVDSMGNVVYKDVLVHVYDTSPVQPASCAYLRYINKKYYEKPYEEGGLHPNSIWRTDAEYRETLEKALDNLENETPKAVYYFSSQEVKEAQGYIDGHGYSDNREEGALQGFFDKFMR